jgi:mannose-P-dolichol utilization defect protein 1
LISVFLQFAGCVARIFTSIQETGDRLVIASFSVAALLNGIIFLQMFIYWDAGKKKVAEQKKKR